MGSFFERDSGPLFGHYIGIDYSGAGHPDEPQPGLRVFHAAGSAAPVEIRPTVNKRGWSRGGIRQWLESCFDTSSRCLVGIDHAFGFPRPYLEQHRIASYRAFLDHAVRKWPTHRLAVAAARKRRTPPPAGEGFRLCDCWTASAKSLFLFDVPGSVASSTLGGLPGIRNLSRRSDVHLWPFDGWKPAASRHVVAEVYPSLWRRRYVAPVNGWTPDQRDAWTVATWLQQADRRGQLARYWKPPLNPEEQRRARQEGWILGVT